MPIAQSPLEKVIVRALKKQGCTVAQLAVSVGMASTNFSTARNNHRSFPLSVLLNLFTLAEISDEEKIRVLEWIAFKKDL